MIALVSLPLASDPIFANVESMIGPDLFSTSTEWTVEVSSAEKEEDPPEKRLKDFLERERENLREEAAQGGGAHLSELAKMLDCGGKEEVFVEFAKTHFQSILASDPSARELTETLLSLRRTFVELQACER